MWVTALRRTIPHTFVKLIIWQNAVCFIQRFVKYLQFYILYYNLCKRCLIVTAFKWFVLIMCGGSRWVLWGERGVCMSCGDRVMCQEKILFLSTNIFLAFIGIVVREIKYFGFITEIIFFPVNNFSEVSDLAARYVLICLY